MLSEPDLRLSLARASHARDERSELAFPKDHRVPAETRQPNPRQPIPFTIGLELGFPERPPSAGYRRESAPSMMVPEASVHEYRQSMPWEDDVGASGQVSSMQPETKAHSMQGYPKGQFWSSVLGPYSGHHPTTHRL